MSLKKIIIVAVALVALIGFIGLGISNAITTKDKLDFQEVELKSKSLEIKQLNNDFDELNQEIEKIEQDKELNQQEVDELQEERDRLQKEKEKLEAEISALKQKTTIAEASEQFVNPTGNVQTVNAAPEPSSGASYSHAEIKQIIFDAANRHGLDPNWFYNLAKCESTWNPDAVNYNYYDNGHPSGLFQHLSGYWAQRAIDHGYAGASVFDPVANANVTASMWKTGSHLWECQ